MIYYNHPHPDKEIKEILKEKHDCDFSFFSILWQLMTEYDILIEIIKLIFTFVYQPIKINECPHTIIINLDKSYLFINMAEQFHKNIHNHKFVDIVKLGIKSVHFYKEYAVILKLDGVLQFMNFITDELTTIDNNIKHINIVDVFGFSIALI